MGRRRGRGENIVARQWLLLRSLPRHPRRLTTSNLLDKLVNRHGTKATIRDVQRDLNALSEHFPLEADTDTVPHRWGWARGAGTAALSTMDLATAFAFAVIEHSATRTLPAAMLHGLERYLATAHKTLKAEGLERQWAAKVRVFGRSWPQAAPPVDPKIVRAVHDALLHNLVLEIGLAPTVAGDPEVVSRVAPVTLVHRGVASYLIATDDGAVQHHALHRIRTARVTKDRATALAKADREREIERVGLGHSLLGVAPFRVRIAFDAAAAATVIEAPFADDQHLVERRSDGWSVFSGTVPDSHLFGAWLLGFGAGAEVLKPAPLRNWMAAQLASAARRYQPPT